MPYIGNMRLYAQTPRQEWDAHTLAVLALKDAGAEPTPNVVRYHVEGLSRARKIRQAAAVTKAAKAAKTIRELRQKRNREVLVKGVLRKMAHTG